MFEKHLWNSSLAFFENLIAYGMNEPLMLTLKHPVDTGAIHGDVRCLIHLHLLKFLMQGLSGSMANKFLRTYQMNDS